jgi:hypothetical protein
MLLAMLISMIVLPRAAKAAGRIQVLSATDRNANGRGMGRHSAAARSSIESLRYLSTPDFSMFLMAKFTE